jgi:phage terminase large subunit
LKDGSRYKGNFGGYGSAKTSTSIQNILKHIVITPNGTGLVGANILAQLEQTIKRDFDQVVPRSFIKEISIQKGYYTFINGYRLIWRPLDDAGKMRSLNLDMIVMVEGSEIDKEFWSIGKTRLRNMVASIEDKEATERKIGRASYNKQLTEREKQRLVEYKADWREQWVESNPDSGWIKEEVLEVSGKVYISGEPLYRKKGIEELGEIDEATSSHISSTSANAYLPKDYVKNLIKNRPRWWVNRYVMASFEFAEGLVYPSGVVNARTKAAHILTEIPKPPRNARYILAHDYGLSDPAGILLGYIESGKLYIYKEYKGQNNNLRELAEKIRGIATIVPQGAWLKPFIIDPKTGPKRDYNKKSLIELYGEYGIYFEPAAAAAVEPGIYKVNTMFEEDKIYISPECKELIEELRTYSFKKVKDSGNSNAPEDKNNHLLDPLRWMVMELPSDMEGIGSVYNNKGELDEKEYRYNALNNGNNGIEYRMPSFRIDW